MNHRIVGGTFIDLSKAFDCIRHDLLITKLHAYGFNHDALPLVHSYLENRPRRVLINGAFSNYTYVKNSVPQWSALGSVFFNIYVNDLLLSIHQREICTYADNITIYVCDKSIKNLIARLENDSKMVID